MTINNNLNKIEKMNQRYKNKNRNNKLQSQRRELKK